MSFGKRLRAARARAGKTQEEIASLFGITREAVSSWEADETFPTADKVPRLAAAVKTTADNLLSGKNHKSDIAEPSADYNVTAGPDIRRQVPLISWVHAGRFEEAVDTLRPGDALEWFPVPKRAGARTYALRVEGDSMTSPYGRSYPDGCIIFVDPEQRDPPNGKRVIAKLEGSDDVTFKVFVQEAGRVFLRALNPQYPPIMEPFKIIGTVIGKWEDE